MRYVLRLSRDFMRITRRLPKVWRAASAVAVAAVVWAPGAPGQQPSAPRGELFERVVDELRDRFYDRSFRRDELPALAERYRPDAAAADSLAEERAVVHALLGEIPASHLAAYSRYSYRVLRGELEGKTAPTVGCQLVRRAGRFYVTAVLEGGPAERAGLRRGDRVRRIDEVPSGRSWRLDWRSDDAYLQDDPIVHIIRCEAADVVHFEVERRRGARLRTISVEVADYSALEAARASARVIERGDRRLGYVHFWYMHMRGVATLMRKLLRGPFAACDGLILDLRGRGGSGIAVFALLKVLERDGRPLVALLDHGSRSAKEVIAYEIRKRELGLLVGEQTAGAVVPASFVDVGHDTVLMLPQTRLGHYTDDIEGVGVEPDVPARAPGSYSEGAQPMIEAGVRALLSLL